MTTFKGGPANGKTLFIHRNPIFLRVVELNGKFDALDQVDDTASDMEKIHVYQFERQGASGFLSCRAGKGGAFTLMDYTFHSTPEDADVRDVLAWQAWCARQQQEQKAGAPSSVSQPSTLDSQPLPQ